MKITYYNTAIKELSNETTVATVKEALEGIVFARYGSSDAHMDNDYWRVVIDGKEYTPDEASTLKS